MRLYQYLLGAVLLLVAVVTMPKAIGNCHDCATHDRAAAPNDASWEPEPPRQAPKRICCAGFAWVRLRECPIRLRAILMIDVMASQWIDNREELWQAMIRCLRADGSKSQRVGRCRLRWRKR